MKLYKIIVFVPKEYGEKIRQVLGEEGAGKQGCYDFCSGTSAQIGRFRPLKGAKPHIGKIGKITEVPEERIESICAGKDLPKVIQAVVKAHPYEEPAIDIIPILDWHQF